MAINSINEKAYVGQAVCTLSNGKKWGTEERWKTHVKNARNRKCECRLLENAILKHGASEFVIVVLEECAIMDLNRLEDLYIKSYNTLCPNGYNLMTGGGNGRKHHQKTRDKMSKTRTGKKHTQITKQRIGDGNRGKIVSSTTRKRVGQSSKYRGMSERNRLVIEGALSELGMERLPMYIYYSLDKRNDRNVDVINVRVSGHKPKKFGAKSVSLADKIKIAVEYITFTLNGHRSEGASHPQ